MAATKLKCCSCNIVISEVLSFIQNKHDVMDNESIIRVCLSAFSEPDIDEAKKLLFESVTTSQRLKSRRKDGKRQRDLEDIISLFKEVDPDAIPVFVARNLQKLPPVSFDHIDVTKLLKDLVLLRTEIENIKDNYATADQLTELRLEMEDWKVDSAMEYQNVNTRKRGTYYLDSGPVGLSHLSNTDFISPMNEQNNGSGQIDNVESRSRSNESISEAVSVLPMAKTSPPKPETTVNVKLQPMEELRLNVEKLLLQTQNKATKPSMAEIVQRPGDWKQNEPKEDWILVQRKRLKNRFVGQRGKAVNQSECMFKAADTKVLLFISNVSKEASETDICEYIHTKTQETVNLERIAMKKEKPYNSFKLFVSKNKLDVFLNDNFWPDGITFRRFIHFKKRGSLELSAKASQIVNHDCLNNGA